MKLINQTKLILLLLSLTAIIFGGCKKEDFTLPMLSTSNVSEITLNSAVSGGNVSSDGGAAVIERGVCWSTSDEPTISDNKTSDGKGAGNFVSSISNLEVNTTYYLRAYSINSKGIAYGNIQTFKTLTPDLPTLTTNSVSEISFNSTASGGNVTSDGGAAVTARGVCWSTSPDPTTSNNISSSGTGIGSFTSSITGLTQGTIYYVRAYATNSGGTAYGNEISFIIDIEGNVYNTVTIGTQIWMAENLKTTKYRNGSSISNITLDADWSSLSSEAYCWFNNDPNNKDLYGALYNWYAVNDPRNIAPLGWHVPTEAEVTTLVNYLGSNAGGKLKETGTTHWDSPNAGATNEVGFNAIPTSYRNVYGTFSPGGWRRSVVWWTTFQSGNNAKYFGVNYTSTDVIRILFDKKDGFAVRLIKD